MNRAAYCAKADMLGVNRGFREAPQAELDCAQTSDATSARVIPANQPCGDLPKDVPPVEDFYTAGGP